ncbi:unnamed protein product [Prorocentrum cordatum]|uniref:Uncharacterized protein n=1 Tax=Prorocentrum cordatum TaxID=2364126 RepID=A0ABN9VXD1_9DINO|nr:unnamed protein product [Polarella glacialis]
MFRGLIVVSFARVATCIVVDRTSPVSVYASHIGHEQTLSPGTQQKYALAISAKGMNSHYGSGVRQMALMMDLKNCGFGVDTLTEEGYDSPDWGSRKAMELLSASTNFHVRPGGNRSSFNASRVQKLMHRYTHIYLFGWAWELEFTYSAETALKALERDPDLRGRVTLVLDDNPYNRCYAGHELAFCRTRAPTMVSRWLNVSSRAMSISDVDAAELNRMKSRLGLPGPDFEAWPLNLEHVEELFSSSLQAEIPQNWTQPYLTMVANDHAENRRFVSELVSGGHLDEICDKTEAVPSGIRRLKVVFVGAISRYMMSKFPGKMARLRKSCVLMKMEVSMEQLQRDIMPQTLALLNPFLDTVNSGISVKTFEAVAMGVPIVTSMAGFRGLEECGKRLERAGLLASGTAAGYVDLISTKLVDPEKAAKFRSMQRDLLHTCVVEQKAEWQNACVTKIGRGSQVA